MGGISIITYHRSSGAYSQLKMVTAVIVIIPYMFLPVVPHKAVAEVSKTGNLLEKLVVVNHGWQS